MRFLTHRLSTPAVLTVLATATVLLTIFGDESYARLHSFRQSVEHQREINGKMQQQVSALKHDVAGLQNDPRALEKAARNELGMTRSNEILVIFDDKKSAGK